MAEFDLSQPRLHRSSPIKYPLNNECPTWGFKKFNRHLNKSPLFIFIYPACFIESAKQKHGSNVRLRLPLNATQNLDIDLQNRFAFIPRFNSLFACFRLDMNCHLAPLGSINSRSESGRQKSESGLLLVPHRDDCRLHFI